MISRGNIQSANSAVCEDSNVDYLRLRGERFVLFDLLVVLAKGAVRLLSLRCLVAIVHKIFSNYD